MPPKARAHNGIKPLRLFLSTSFPRVRGYGGISLRTAIACNPASTVAAPGLGTTQRYNTVCKTAVREPGMYAVCVMQHAPARHLPRQPPAGAVGFSHIGTYLGRHSAAARSFCDVGEILS